jgi:hypothetical protein
MPTQKTVAQGKKKVGRAKVAPKLQGQSRVQLSERHQESNSALAGAADGLAFCFLLVFGLPALLILVAFFLHFFPSFLSSLFHCDVSQSSSTFTISAISQSLGVTPAAIAGVTFKV